MVAPASRIVGSHVAGTAMRANIAGQSWQGQKGAAANSNVAMPKPRHQHSRVEDGIESVADTAGEGLFGLSFMAGVGGWLTRNTIGWFSPKIRSSVGLLSHAPFQALDKTSIAQLRTGGLDVLKANYWASAAEFAEKHGKGVNAKEFAANAAKYGGAQLAQPIKWGGISQAGKWLAHKPLFSAVMGVGLGVGALMALRHAEKDTVDGLADLKAVAEDLTGQKVTTHQLLHQPETLPKMVQEIRANLKAHLLPNAIGAMGHVVEKGAFAAMGGPATHAAGGMFGLPMAGMMGGMMLSQSAESFRPSLDFVNAYLDVKDLKDSGQEVAPEFYAQLIASASPEARRSGGVESRLVKALAEQYAKEGISARDLVHEVEAVEPFQKRATELSKQIEALDKKDKAKPAHEGPIGSAPVQTPADGRNADSDNPITAKLSQENEQAAREEGKPMTKSVAPASAEKPSHAALKQAAHEGTVVSHQRAVGGAA